MKLKPLFIAFVFFISNANAIIQTSCIPRGLGKIDIEKIKECLNEDGLIYAKCIQRDQSGTFFYILNKIEDYEALNKILTDTPCRISFYFLED